MTGNAPKNFDLDAFLPYRVNVLASRLSLDLARVYETRFGISIAEWRVLAHLASHARVSVREIHARVSMDRVKVSRAAARLEAAGHISKEINPSDRRLVELQLTARGRALFDTIAPLALSFEEEALAVLSHEEQAHLRVLIEKMLSPTTDRQRDSV